MENVADIYKLSPIQSGMLFHAISEPESDVYFGQYSCTLEGTINSELFQKAWRQVVERHSVLRTLFLWENVKEPLQIVRQHVELPWQVLDWKELTTADQKVALESYLETDRKQGFELTHAPLLRFALIHLSAESTQFIWSTHHLILDGWSTALVINEVLTIYEQLLANKPPQLEPPRPYSEYIAWTQQQDLDKAGIYWRQSLAGFTEPTVLPIRLTSTNDSGYSHQHLTLSKQVTTALQEIARNNRLTMSTLIQGAWSILLSRYTHQQDVLFGVTMAGRPTDLVEADKRVGLFINTLPARIKLSPEQSLVDLLSHIQTQQTELREYESTPLVKVQQWSDVPASQALFESIVVFENYPVMSNEEGKLTIKDVHFTEHSHYPLSLLIFPDQHNLRFKVVYDCSLFSDADIERLLGHLQTLLVDMTAGLDRPVRQLDILTQQEHQHQLIDWNNSQYEYPKDQCIHQLIETYAESQATAVVTADNQSISYTELHQQANQLAHHLQSLGIKQGTLVGLCINRSIDMIVGILGILKAGGAYVPLDPSYPSNRLELMLSDFASTETVLVTESSLLSTLPKHEAQIVCLDRDLENQPNTAPNSHSSTEDVAYMIYTSGSTGKPKGVLVSHRNLVHSTLARKHHYPEDFNAFLLLSSFAFDSSIAGIFWSLSQGKTLVLPKPDQEKDIVALAHLIKQYQVSHMLCVPSLYQQFLSYADTIQLGSLSTVIVAGEACAEDLLKHHCQVLPSTALYNEYGPTEATVWSTVAQLQPSQAITIGKPIANTQIYILDEQQNAVPIGVPGELYIGGDGVSPGYYNQPEITSHNFIPNPFSPESGAQLYRTGDLARYRADSDIEFLGRVDQQVKIHGYRIELGEIESVLKQDPNVFEALAITRNEQIIAYIKANESVSIFDLQTQLANKLPDYMQANHIVTLDEFPLLPNGKIDHQALPEPIQEQVMTDFIAPRNEIEQTLADIWADVLGMDSISVNDHFLQIGGDSILSIQMIARARQAGLFFTPNDLFERPEIAQLAEIVKTESSAEESQSQEQVEGEVPLTPIQHWFFETITPVPQYWNQAIQLAIPATLTATQLHEALQFLYQHHDALRMSFAPSTKGWQQTNQANDSYRLPWQEFDLSGFRLEQQEEMIEKKANQLQSQLDFSNSSLQTAFFQCADQTENRLLIISHHLIIDHVSWKILVEDLEQLCQQLISQQSALPVQPFQLAEKTTSYQDYSKQLSNDAQSDKSITQLADWLDFLHIPSTPLPVDFPEQKANNTEETHCVYSASLSQLQTRALLQDVPQTYQTQINDVLLTALLQTLHTWTGNPFWLIGMELHGRDQAGMDLSRSIGWFTHFFPIALKMHETETGALIKSVKEQLRKIPKKGQSYGALRYLSTSQESKQLTELPQADILFNYLGQLQQPSAKLCKLLTDAKSGDARSLRNKRSHLLEINVVISEGELIANWSYSDSLYKPSTIENLAESFIAKLDGIIKHCQSPNVGGFTPSDFAESGLDQNQLDQFIGSITK